MQISEQSIKEFQRLWKADYGEDITADQARAIGSRVLEVFTLLRAARSVAPEDKLPPSP